MTAKIFKSTPYGAAGLLCAVAVVVVVVLQSIWANEAQQALTKPRATGSDNAMAAGAELATTDQSKRNQLKRNQPMGNAVNLAKATFGSGCFWCTEAIFQNVRGVHAVQSGYTGGSVKNPTYKDICSGTTGHAEVIQVQYDPLVISYPELLEIFWQTHDPTTLNRQGHDIGTQYRSAIFYHDDEQRRLAEEYKRKLDESGAFHAPIVTEITKCEEFYPAEDYHQDYFKLNPRQPYCMMVVRPKVEKFKKVFREKLKELNSAALDFEPAPQTGGDKQPNE